MLISSWLKSLRGCLQASSRRTSYRRQAAGPGNRQSVMPRVAEAVEERVLLSAPTLVKIASTNTGVLLSTDSDNPDTLPVAPEQFTLTFNPGQSMDVASAQDAISVTRSDGSPVNIGFIGEGASPEELVVRFAENLADDDYTLNIGETLQNTGGEFFNDSGNSGVGEAQEVPFNLDLGAQVVAIVPQPVNTSGTLSQVRNQIVVYFNDDDLDSTLAGMPEFYQLINAEPNPADPNDLVRLPSSAVYDSASDTAILTFANNIEDLFGAGESLFRLRIGTNEVIPSAPIRIDMAGSASTTFGYLQDEDSDGVDEFVEVTFHLADPPAGKSEEGKSVELNFTADNSATTSTPTIVVNPATGQVDVTLSANGGFNTTLAELLSAIASNPAASGLIRVEVTPNSNLEAGIGATLAGASETLTLFDAGSSFRTAGDDSNRIADVGILNGTGVVVSAAIDPQLYPFDFPGASDEPGQREIELFRFVPSFDTRFHPAFVDEPNPVQESFDRFPLGFVDPAIVNNTGVETLFYNFQSFVGFDPEGLERTNTITENQKQRVREVFDFYSDYLGVQFVETSNRGFTIARSDLRVLNGELFDGAGDDIVGAADPARQLGILDASENWNDTFGDYTDPQDVGTVNFFEEAMEVVGLLLGLGNTDHLPDRTVQGFGNSFFTTGNTTQVELDYPGDHDIVGGRVVHPPESKDIDLYRFEVETAGLFSAEIFAERLDGVDTSLLDATLQLYQVIEDTPGGIVQESTLIAQNDDYFSEDSFMELNLDAGVYFIGVSASGNDDYDPTIEDTGINGTSQGKYELNLDFRPDVSSGDALIDETGTLFDGDHDGVAGGVANFWFRAVPAASTYFVNRTESVSSGSFNTLATGERVYSEIDMALSAASPGTIVRIVGNSEGQGYEIGRDGINLRDGSTLEVPQGVTVMIDAGAILKLNQARIGVGSFDQVTDRSGGSLQVLGTPDQKVVFTSWKNEQIGGNTTATPTTPANGDWGGIIFQEDIDRNTAGRTVHSDSGVFMNYVAFGEFTYGGGRLNVGSSEQTINPIHTIGARPTVLNNTIVLSNDSAISADPNSFEETRFTDYSRIGPEIYGNILSATSDTLQAVNTVDGDGNPIRVQNASNGLFIRVLTPAGNAQDALTVSARFDDRDITHILTGNLVVQGTPGGHLDTVEAPELDAGIPNRTTLTSAGVGDLPYGTYTYRMTFVELDGGGNIVAESPPSDPSESLFITGDPTTGSAIQLTNLPSATGTFNGRRLYRSHDGVVYTLVSELNASTTSFLDDQFASGAPLDTRSFDQSVARYDAGLVIDPGIIIKAEDAAIQIGIGAHLIAEGEPGREIVFTSRKDDSFGAGGTFDTNDDASVVGAPQATAGDWGGIFVGHLASASISDALVTYGGGSVTVAGGFATFNAIEIHQAQARIVNTILENNADGTGGSSPAHRLGRGANGSAVIFVRGAQPVIANNTIRNNDSAAISINANALNHDLVRDWGRTRGEIVQLPGYVGNRGPLIDQNTLDGNSINGMHVRGEVLTTQGVWDDTGIVHVVLDDEIVVPDVTTYGGLRLESSSTESLVVKLSGANAGFTAVGRPLDIEDRIGGTLHIIGQPGKPVVLTSMLDDSVGAGFNAQGLPQNDTNNDGTNTSAGGDSTPVDNGTIGPIDVTGTTSNGNALRDTLLGSGITAIGDATFIGGATSAGFFDDGFASLGMKDGIILTTGHAAKAEPDSTSTGVASQSGDADLDATFGVTTLDTTSLEFDFESAGGNLFFNFVFASDEYNSFVNASFNDAFALYLDGENIALVPGTTTPISVNNVNGGNPLGTDATNPEYYRNNTGASAEVPTLLNYGGLTNLFTAQATGLSTGVHTIKMVISDVGDTILDSAVFVQAGTFSDSITGASGGDWGSITIDQFANDRNVGIHLENEADAATAPGPNATAHTAEFIGTLAPLEDITRAGDLDPLTGPSGSLRGGGDTTLRLGFQVNGALNENNDVDVYSFKATSGSEVWLDIDNTRHSLDTVIDLIDADGSVLASTDSTLAEQAGQHEIYENPASVVTGLKANTLNKSLFESDDFFSTNQRDAGMRVVLPGTLGADSGIFYVRVRSSSIDSLDMAEDRSDLLTASSLSQGKTSGSYELQIRLREKDEVPGSTVRYADIRFATDGIRILGQPTHSPLQGEFSEDPSGDISNNFGSAPDLGNVLNTDQGALSISAALNREDDIDWFRFDVIPDSVRDSAIENPDGPLVFEGGTPIIFDLDYSDDNGGGNTRLSVFNSAGQLVLFSDDSNITDDRPAGNEPGGDADDKSRGSVGAQDPYIGPVELPAGTYYAAVTSKALLPSALEYLLQEPGAALDEVRLEPVNSIVRIADEGFEQFENEYLDIDQATAVEPITDLFNEDDLSANVVPWELSDVALYVSTSGGLTGTSRTTIRTLDAFTGLTETVVGPRVSGVQPVGDIAMRYDGELYGFATGPDVGPVNDASTQAFLNFATSDGAASAVGSTGINTFFRDGMDTVVKGNSGNTGFGFNVDALGYYDGGDAGGLLVGHRNVAGTQTIQPMNENILYYFNVDSGRAADDEDDVATEDGFYADYRAGSNRRSIGFIDTVGDGTTGADGGLGGRITGIAFPDASRFGGSNGYGITDRGELHAFQPFSSGVDGSVQSSFLADIGTLIGRPGISFQGLAAGPDDIEPLTTGFGQIGRYEDVLFAVSSDGILVAIDVSAVSFLGGTISGTAELAPVLQDGQSSIQLTNRFGGPLTGITGLDFGTLTRNLWHVDFRDPDDVGHGAETPFDFSRSNIDDGLEGQSAALFFGNSDSSADAGNKNDRGRDDDDTDIRNLDFPNGAAGSIISNAFDLSSYTAGDKPVLEFNYYLQTENANAEWGNDTETPDNSPMRDAFRVFVGGDDGVWNLVGTNDSLQTDETMQRIDEFDYAPIDPENPLSIQEPISDGTGVFSTFPLGQDYPDVVELYDDPNHAPGDPRTWYPARIDLSSFVGRSDLRLRFDFSTAGGMDFADGFFQSVAPGVRDVFYGDRNEEVLALPAAELRDGLRFELDGDGNFTDIDAFNSGATTNVPVGEHFEFDFGHLLVAPSGTSVNDGDTLSIDGTVFEFEKTLPALATNPVVITDYATTGDVANAIVAAVNAAALPGVHAVAVGNRVNIVGATTVDASSTSAMATDGTPGVRAGHHAVNLTLDMDRESVALAIKTSLATQFSATTVDPTNIKGFHQLGYLEIVGHSVTNNGPLGWSNTLPGDEFGAFGAGVSIGDDNVRTVGALRGANNRIEGVWLDDIVIGIAERGEMVTNAPVNTNFRIDTRIYGGSFDPDGDVDRDHRKYTGTPNNLDQLTGAYTLEIRQASDFAVQAEDFPVKTHLYRSFDTNERLAEAVTLHVPSVDQVFDGMTFTLDDGIDEITFEFDDINVSGGVSASHVAVPFDAIVDAFNVNSSSVIANTIASILNSSTVSNVLAVSAAAIGGRVEIYGNVRLTFANTPSLGITGRIANNVETTHQTAPLGPFDTFQLENTSATESIVSASLTLPEGQFFDLRDAFSTTALYEGADPVASPYSDIVGASFFSDEAMTVPLADGSRTAYIRFTNFEPGERYHFNVGVSHFVDEDFLLLLPQFRNFATADSGSRHLVGTALSVVFDSNRLASGNFHDARLVNFDNDVSEAVLGAAAFDVTIHDLHGDRNIEREQGQIIIESNSITDSANFAIVSGPGESNLSNHSLGNFAPGAGILAGQGAARNAIELNDLGLVPGVVIENNILARGGLGGIDFAGDSDGVAPFGRIVNNTILGAEGATGTGILVRDNASPTIINNAVTRVETGISVDSTSFTVGTVIGANFYVDNTNDHGGVATYGTFDASDKQAGNPDWTIDGTFVDASVTNLYPASGSPLIDSSLDSLNDRSELVTIRDPLGIAASPVFAPDLDAFGQTRADDDAPGTGPGAPGANVRKDRGAIDRVDFETPRGTVLLIDSRLEGAVEIQDEQVRLDSLGEVILAESDTASGEIGRLAAGAATAVRKFVLRLSDVGIGIDDAPILAAVNDTSGEIPLPFTLQQDGETLVEGTDYFFVWNSNTDEAIFTHLTEFPLERLYTILVDNDPATGARSDLPGSTLDPHPDDGVTGIRDLAGNFLEINQADGSTQFTILLTDGVNDPPIHSLPEERQSVGEDDFLIFSETNGNAITVSDADVHLAADPVLTTTIAATNGRLSLGDSGGVTFPLGGNGVGEVAITMTGTVEALNAALEGLRYTPDAEYFNLLPGEAPDANLDPVTITITTNDGGRFSTDNTPQTDTDTILVDVISVNDVPIFNTPLTPPPAVDEDSASVSITSFVTGINTGSPLESSQRVEFTVSTTVLSGNLAFAQAPEINAAGTLTYHVAADTNGTVRFTIVASDFDDTDPNHVSASSAPAQVDLVVNPVNDAPIFAVDTSVSIDSNEDEGVVGPFNFISSFSAGPAAATDETHASGTRQTLTFLTSTPVTTVGNLTLDSLSVVDGVLHYEATPNTSGSVTFNVSLMDDGSTLHIDDQNTSSEQVVTINVLALPDAPVPSSIDYILDDGNPLTLDASSTTDPDIGFAGVGVTETLAYSWDLDNDGAYDLVDSADSIITIPFSTLAGLGLTAPVNQTITLRVTDTFAGTATTTTANLQLVTVDYGDAPDDDFGTLLSSGNPAAHTIVAGFHLGLGVDGELDGTVAPAEDSGDDGVVFEAGMQADTTIDSASFFNATASAPGKLDIWIDFDNNGTFQASEHLNDGISIDLVAGDNRFEFPIPAGSAETGVDLWARARFSSVGSLGPTGRADDGEVEDYQLQISELLDAVDVEHVSPMWSQTSDLTPRLEWRQAANTAVGANATHRVELRNSLNQIVGLEEDHPFMYLDVSDPLAPGVYTLVVTPFNRAGAAGSTVSLAEFEVVAIEITAPTGSTTNGRPTIAWTSVTETDHYELEILERGTNTIVLEARDVAVASYTVTDELPLGSYDIRVRAVESVTGQIGDWSDTTTISVQTAPNLTGPSGVISAGQPTITWESVPGVVSYDVRVIDVTDNIDPVLMLTGVTGNSTTLPTDLSNSQYSVEVRGVSSLGTAGAWSVPSIFTVGFGAIVNVPHGQIPDATPTVSWAPVLGADHYTVEVTDVLTSTVVYSQSGISSVQHTLPSGSDLAMGHYEVRVISVDLPADEFSGDAVSVPGTPSAFTVTAAPDVLTPNVTTFLTTPEITWAPPAGAVTSELEIYNVSEESIHLVEESIAGSSFTVPTFGNTVGETNLELSPGTYRIRVRSYGGENGSIVSDWSSPHIFQVGATPVALGPSGGLGEAPYTRTESTTPTLTAQQSLAGATYKFWLSSVTENRVVEIQSGVESPSYTVEEESLSVGRYRYWVQATTNTGEVSPWSRSYDFDVTSTPVLDPIGPTFDRTPVFRWNASTGVQQTEVTSYQVWINNIDVVPAQIVLVENNVTSTEFDIADYIDGGLANGRYKVWVRGFVEGVNDGKGTVTTEWSAGEVLEIGGRPAVTSPSMTADNTPSITWTPVDGAVSYELYLAEAASISDPIVRITDLTTTTYQVRQPLGDGVHYAWVRARSATGERSPWSLNSNSRFTINPVTQAVIDPVADGTDRTPTFTWSPVTGAGRYEIYVSTVADSGTPLIRDANITTTSYTPESTLPAGDFRVWVRAIGASGQLGAWSAPERFMLTDLDMPQDPQIQGPVLASLNLASEPSDTESDIVRSERHIPTTSRSGSSGSLSTEALLPENAVVSDIRGVESADEADQVMSNWDDEIWAEESTGVALSENSATAIENDTDSTGWLAGMALLSPSVFRRRKKENKRS